MAQPDLPDEIPNAAWRARLVNKLVGMGYRGTDLADIIAPGRTRREMTDDLIDIQQLAEKEE